MVADKIFCKINTVKYEIHHTRFLNTSMSKRFFFFFKDVDFAFNCCGGTGDN